MGCEQSDSYASYVWDTWRIYCGVSAFNQDIGDWDVGRVTNFRAMFRRNHVFNQDISDWNMISATAVNQMFDRATGFNNGGVSLNCWDTSNVTIFDGMFLWGH